MSYIHVRSFPSSALLVAERGVVCKYASFSWSFHATEGFMKYPITTQSFAIRISRSESYLKFTGTSVLSTNTRPRASLANRGWKKCTVSTLMRTTVVVARYEFAPLSFSVVYNDGSRRPDPSAFSKLELWHSDVSYELQPPSTTSLKVIEGPPYGGDTLWSSG